MRFPRITPSLAISCAALLVALGGTGYAATTLAKNSVGSTQLKKNAVTSAKIGKNAVTSAKIKAKAVTSAKLASNAVTSAKIKNGTITADDLAAGVAVKGDTGATGPQGPAGPAGATGATGATGSSGVLWADAQSSTSAPAYPGASCGLTCLDILTSGTFTTPVAGKVFVTAALEFGYTCDVANSLNCATDVAIYVDGQPLTGGARHLANVAKGTTGEFNLTVTGVTTSALAAGAHDLEVYGVITNGMNQSGSSGGAVGTSEILVGS